MIDGKFDDWMPVQSSFKTDPGTVMWQNYYGYGKALYKLY
jgi:hypothetical protein